MITPITPSGMIDDIVWLAESGYWDDHSFKELCARYWQPSYMKWVLETLAAKRRVRPGSKIHHYGLILRELRLSRELRQVRGQLRART